MLAGPKEDGGLLTTDELGRRIELGRRVGLQRRSDLQRRVELRRQELRRQELRRQDYGHGLWDYGHGVKQFLAFCSPRSSRPIYRLRSGNMV